MLEMRDAGIGSAQCGMPMGRSVRLVASMRDGDGTRYTGLGVVRPKFFISVVVPSVESDGRGFGILACSITCWHAKMCQRITSHYISESTRFSWHLIDALGWSKLSKYLEIHVSFFEFLFFPCPTLFLLFEQILLNHLPTDWVVELLVLLKCADSQIAIRLV